MTVPQLVFLVLWWLTLQALPVYVFEAGMPQPADYALIVVAGVPAATGVARVMRARRPVVVALAGFLTVVVTVNVFWASYLGSTQFLIATMHFLFNTAVLIGMLSLGNEIPKQFAHVTANALTLSIIIQVGLSFVLRNGIRLQLLFANPNQLAYFALGVATIVTLVAQYGDPLLRRYAFVALVAAGWLCFRTYSRAAMLGLIGLMVLWGARRPVLALALVLPALVVGAASDISADDDPMWRARIEQMTEGSPSDYIEDRALTRIVQFPEYLLAGAGEGEYRRFHHHGLELHSSLANVAFSYGILGLGTFIVFLYRCLSAAGRQGATLLVPALAYGLFHNGLRFRIFWMALAIAIIVSARLVSKPAAPTAGGGGTRLAPSRGPPNRRRLP